MHTRSLTFTRFRSESTAIMVPLTQAAATALPTTLASTSTASPASALGHVPRLCNSRC